MRAHLRRSVLTCGAAATLVVLLGVGVPGTPAAAQEDPGKDGEYDLRDDCCALSIIDPPPGKDVLRAIPDQRRYAELSEQATELEAEYDAAVQAEKDAEAESDKAYGKNDAAGGEAAFQRANDARAKQEMILKQAEAVIEEMHALESEGEDARLSGSSRDVNEGLDDVFVSPGEVGAASDDAPERTAAGASDPLKEGMHEGDGASGVPQEQPQAPPEQASSDSQEVPNYPGIQDGLDAAGRAVDSRTGELLGGGSSTTSSETSGGGGGLNPLAVVILILVALGAGAVYLPRVLSRTRSLPLLGERAAQAYAAARTPMQARSSSSEDAQGEPPRMGPWKPEGGGSPDEPQGEEPRTPPRREPDPEPPTPEDPLTDPNPTTPPPPPTPRPTPGFPGVRPPAPQRGAPKRGNPRRSAPQAPRGSTARETIPDEHGGELTDEELAYFFPHGRPAGAETKRQREERSEREKADERRRLRELPERLLERTIGQDHAVVALAEAVQVQRTGFGGERPVSVMFAGTSGVGKTETSKALADTLYGGEGNMIRLDMSEYMEKLQASRFVGAPPGYVGHDEVPPLVQKMLEDPRRVVLFDEIEKAHPDILNYLLQILDDGRLTSSKGETLDFRQAVVVLTTNLGSEEIREAFERGEVGDEGIPERTMKELLREKGMRPELVNRVGEIVTFRPLDQAAVLKIAGLMLEKTKRKMREANGVEVVLTDGAAAWIARRGYEPENGARPLRGAIRDHVERPLSRALLGDEISPGDAVLMDAADSGEGLTLQVTASSSPKGGGA
jgi:MoxR-like ATPase